MEDKVKVLLEWSKNELHRLCECAEAWKNVIAKYDHSKIDSSYEQEQYNVYRTKISELQLIINRFEA